MCGDVVFVRGVRGRGDGGLHWIWVETSALFVGLGQPGVWGMREARVTGDLDECMMRAALLPDWAAGCEILPRWVKA